MTHYERLCEQYAQWESRYSTWDFLRTGFPLKFRNGFLNWLGAPLDTVPDVVTGKAGPYVDLFVSSMGSDGKKHWEHAEWSSAAQDMEDGSIAFWVGVTIERAPKSLPRLTLIAQCNVRSVDDRTVELTLDRRPGSFRIDPENPADLEAVFQEIYGAFFEYLGAPIGGIPKGPIGFTIAESKK